MDGGFSVSDLEGAGIPGTTLPPPLPLPPLATTHSPLGRSRRRGSYRSLAVALPGAAARSVTPGFFYDSFDDEEPHHFLDSCFLCKKPLGSNRDIFMYRGDTPFCSEECRQEQIEMDEADEKNKKLSSLMDQKQKKSTATSPSKAQRLHFRPGTVVAG